MVSITSIVLLLIISIISKIKCQSPGNCGGNPGFVQLTSVVISPQPPIKIPTGANIQTINLALDVNLNQDLVHPVRTVMELSIRVFGIWFPVACPDGVKCVFDDWCNDICKTCLCPLKAGRQIMNMPMNITSAIPAGTFKGKISFTSATGQTGCAEVLNIVTN